MVSGEDGFEIVRDEFGHMDIDEFIKNIMMGGIPSHQVEMYGSWYREEKEPDWRCQTESISSLCARPERERHEIINRLYAAWMHRPELTLAQLISMPFATLGALFRANDQDFINAVENIKSLDHPLCEVQIEKNMLVMRGLHETLARIEHAVDSIDGIISDLGGD